MNASGASRSTEYGAEPLRFRAALPLLAALVLLAAIVIAMMAPAAPGPRNSATTSGLLAQIELEIAFYRQRSELHRGDGLDLAALADAYLRKARVSGWATWYLLAEQSARRSLANLPFGNIDARLVLADVAEARHDFVAATRHAEGVLRERPGQPRALATLATAQLARGDLAGAEDAARTLVARLPTATSLALLAVAQAARGNDAAALASFDAAIRAEESSETWTAAWTRVQLARLHLARGRLAEAEAELEAALAHVADYPLARLELAAVRLAQGRPTEGERLYAAVLDTASDSATVFDHVALQGVARARVLNGDATGAEEMWRRAETVLRADVNRDAFGHASSLAHLLLERGRAEDVSEAVALLQDEATRRRDPRTLDLLAWALLQAGRSTEARAVAEEALALAPTPAALLRAAEVADGANDLEAAAYRSRSAERAPDFDLSTLRALGYSR